MWHSIVGASDLLDSKIKKTADKWVLIGFSIVFVLIQIALAIWFFSAKKQKDKLEKEEAIFVKNYNLPRQLKVNVSLKSFNYRVRM